MTKRKQKKILQNFHRKKFAFAFSSTLLENYAYIHKFSQFLMSIYIHTYRRRQFFIYTYKVNK